MEKLIYSFFFLWIMKSGLQEKESVLGAQPELPGCSLWLSEDAELVALLFGAQS